MKETIVYIGGELPDIDASALRILSNCRAIREGGYNVSIISPSKDANRLVRHTEIVHGFKVHYLPYPKSLISWFEDLIALKPYIDIINQYSNVKAIICYNHHAVSLARLINYCHKNGIKVYADCTEWHTTNHLSFIKRIIKSLNTSFRINRVQKMTDGIISISHFFMDFYKNHPNVIYVPPLIDILDPIWHFTPKINSTRTFSYTGRVGIGKDLLTEIIDCFASIMDTHEFRFMVAGCTKEEYIARHPDDYRKLIALNDRIIFHGYCSHQEAVQITQKSDFSFLIRDHNRKNDSGFPTKLSESVACGTPVIATDFSNIRYYIEKYGIGLIIDKRYLSEAIINAIEMPDNEVQELKNNCIKCNAFDYRNYVSPLCEFIEK